MIKRNIMKGNTNICNNNNNNNSKNNTIRKNIRAHKPRLQEPRPQRPREPAPAEQLAPDLTCAVTLRGMFTGGSSSRIPHVMSVASPNSSFSPPDILAHHSCSSHSTRPAAKVEASVTNQRLPGEREMMVLVVGGC